MQSPVSKRVLPIGVFDSGVGGLTVLRAIREVLPAEDLLYLGDTARVPYGTKSPESVCRYALQASEALVSRGIKALVVACNTASAVSLDTLAKAYPGMPIIGVIEPGARAACQATRTGAIAVIATEGTIQGGAYERAVARLKPEIQVFGQACSLFVALAEEGWVEGALLEQVLARYLDPLLKTTCEGPAIDALVLGCTHFPVLKTAIARVAGASVSLVDSAETTASEVCALLQASGLENPKLNHQGRDRFMATDGPHRFARVAAQFLGRELPAEQVEQVDLGVCTADLLASVAG